jgi:hypothetical protein
MLDIALKKQLAKPLCEGDFLRSKGQFQSIPNGDGTDLNSSTFKTYATAATDKLSFTAGYMGLYWV